MGPGKTETTVQPSQMLPQATAGYGEASNYYRGTLANPPVYGGRRTAGPSSVQRELYSKAGGLLDPEGERAAVAGLATPMFQKFQTETMPGISARSQVAGQGVTGSRRQIAEGTAINQLGQGIGAGAVAPVYLGRPAAATATSAIGAQQRATEQEALTAEQQKFEEPYFKQNAAAQAIMQSLGLSSGGTSASTSLGTMGTVNAASQTAANAALAAKLGYQGYKAWA